MWQFNPAGKAVNKHRQYLRSKGWKRTTQFVFGISEEAWIKPASQKVFALERAVAHQLDRDRRAK